jgi:UPF0271 protein
MTFLQQNSEYSWLPKKEGMKLDRSIDINCDMGESYGIYTYGSDEEIMPYISSANIACGYHAGDHHVMRKSVELAAKHGVRVGAHVGFQDKQGFGRRFMDITPEEVYELTIYQIGALDGFLKISNMSMSHVKLHGALYMLAMENREIAEAMIRAVRNYNEKLDVYALPNSLFAKCAKEANLTVLNEFFADRPYENNKVKMFGWTQAEIGGPADAGKRVLRALQNNIEPTIETICVHSDTNGVPEIVKHVCEALVHSGWTIGRGDYDKSRKNTIKS